jgi:hypothetical protein
MKIAFLSFQLHHLKLFLHICPKLFARKHDNRLTFVQFSIENLNAKLFCIDRMKLHLMIKVANELMKLKSGRALSCGNEKLITGNTWPRPGKSCVNLITHRVAAIIA